MSPPARPSLRTISMTIVAFTLGAAACSGDDTSASERERPAPTTTTSAPGSATPTTPPAVASDAAVLDAYREFWRVFDAYAAEAAPFDPVGFKDRFSPVATGGEYDHLYSRFQLDRVRGWVTRGGEADVYRPEIVESDDGRAVVEDCADDSGGIYDTIKDTVIEPETPGARSFLRVVLTRTSVDDRWKVTSVGGEDTECAA